MKITNTLIFSILFAVGCKTDISNVNRPLVLESKTKEITTLFNGQSHPWEINEGNFTYPYLGKDNEIGFITEKDTTNIRLAPNDSVKIDFIINKTDTIQTMWIGQKKLAEFDIKYIEDNKGKYEVFSPEVHELVNISVALTNIGKKDSNMVYMESDYYRGMIDHFDEFQSHPLIDSLNQNITEVFGRSTYDYYYNIRMNACMYSFDNDNIINKSPYSRLAFDENNQLEELLPILEDFSEKSDFKKFYKENEEFYQSLINSYYKLVPINKMWQWIEEKFPQKYESYKIYFSPLIGGAHSTRKFIDNNFKETVMFINAPKFSKEYDIQEKEAILSRIVFTEIDHNYVNPTTDKFQEINVLLEPLECWNNGAQGYKNSYDTFNEYMTWAVFTIYLFDNFDKETFEKRNRIEAELMVNHRGFVKFKEFNEFVLKWYKKNPEKSIEELYPEAIAWIKNESCNH